MCLQMTNHHCLNKKSKELSSAMRRRQVSKDIIQTRNYFVNLQVA